MKKETKLKIIKYALSGPTILFGWLFFGGRYGDPGLKRMNLDDFYFSLFLISGILQIIGFLLLLTYKSGKD